jgi:hypothetical protein
MLLLFNLNEAIFLFFALLLRKLCCFRVRVKSKKKLFNKMLHLNGSNYSVNFCFIAYIKEEKNN